MPDDLKTTNLFLRSFVNRLFTRSEIVSTGSGPSRIFDNIVSQEDTPSIGEIFYRSKIDALNVELGRYEEQFDSQVKSDLFLSLNLFGDPALKIKGLNSLPSLINETPAEGSVDVPIDIDKLSVTVDDPEGDGFDWLMALYKIEDSSYKYLLSKNTPHGGMGTEPFCDKTVISFNITEDLEYDTEYVWNVMITDHGYGGQGGTNVLMHSSEEDGRRYDFSSILCKEFKFKTVKESSQEASQGPEDEQQETNDIYDGDENEEGNASGSGESNEEETGTDNFVGDNETGGNEEVTDDEENDSSDDETDDTSDNDGPGDDNLDDGQDDSEDETDDTSDDDVDDGDSVSENDSDESDSDDEDTNTNEETNDNPEEDQQNEEPDENLITQIRNLLLMLINKEISKKDFIQQLFASLNII